MAVEALHVFVANVRARSGAAVVGNPTKAGADRPCVACRVGGGILLGRRLAGGPLGLAQGSWDTDGCSGLVDTLVASKRQLCVAGRGGRDICGSVEARVCGRDLCIVGLAVGMLLVGLVLWECSRGGESRGHVGGEVAQREAGSGEMRGAREV